MENEGRRREAEMEYGTCEKVEGHARCLGVLAEGGTQQRWSMEHSRGRDWAEMAYGTQAVGETARVN